MLLGSPARTASLTLALKVHTRPVTSVTFSSRREPPAQDAEEEMDAVEDDAEEETD